MNFINPYVEIYFRNSNIDQNKVIPYYKEVIWCFLKNIDNRMKLFQHRINIIFDGEITINSAEQFAGVYEYNIANSGIIFQDSTELINRIKLLEILNEAFTVLAKKHNWDIHIIEDAYRKAIIEKGKFSYSTEKKLNRKKTHSGQLIISLNRDVLTYNIAIEDIKTSVIRQIRLLITNEDNFSWFRYFRDFSWRSNELFGLKISNGEIWIVANIETGIVYETVEPLKKSKEKLDEILNEIKNVKSYLL